MRVRDCWNPLGMGGGGGQVGREGWEEEGFYADLLAHLDHQGKGHREERETVCEKVKREALSSLSGRKEGHSGPGYVLQRDAGPQVIGEVWPTPPDLL